MHLKSRIFNIKIFWYHFIIEAKRFLHYPFDFAMSIFNRVFVIFLVAIFWYVVSQNSSGELPIQNLVSYFLIVVGLMRLIGVEGNIGSDISKKIKYGKITTDLIRPVSILPVLIARNQGWNIGFHLVSIIFLVIGVLLTPEGVHWGQLSIAVFAAVFYSMSYNLLIASIAFHFTEAGGFKNVLQHSTRFINGALIPISFMPLALQNFLFFLPFPFALYVPTIILQGDTISWPRLFYGLAICILFYLAIRKFWNYSLRKYEAIGL